MTDKHDLTLTINGFDHAITVDARRTLADAIRDQCGQTGTHIGCEHGVCGSCTLLLDGVPVRSCLIFAVQCEGLAIRTVEGLAKGEELHPLQRSFIKHMPCNAASARQASSCWRSAFSRTSPTSPMPTCASFCRPISAAARAMPTSSRRSVRRPMN